jgi:hypothetical protein
MCLSKWLSATLAIALMANTTMAEDTVLGGKIKSINATAKTFVLTDANNKDNTFALGTKLVINRGGKESKSDLKVGDQVTVCYDPGLVTWTSHYILIHEGDTKSSVLSHGIFKTYNADKKELSFKDASQKKDFMYGIGEAVVRVNMSASNPDELKIGDRALLISYKTGTKYTLQSVMVDRAK